MTDSVTALSAQRQARLLIVDDEPHIRSALMRALNLMGYSTEGVGTGSEALALLERESFDLMVLDMRMPGLDGAAVMEQAQRVSPDLLIIILTGHATLQTAISAVRAEQVVDYLMKPASIHEVAAAIAEALQKRTERLEKERLVSIITRAVDDLRRTPSRPLAAGLPREKGRPERFLHAHPLVLDRPKRLVMLEEDSTSAVELTEGEAAVLACLMAEPDQVFSCSQLAKVVWGYEMSEEEALGPIRSHVFRLRRKLDQYLHAAHLVQTVRGGGYLFSPTAERE
ncbi:MAG: response regulator transcription factor [Chloroflexota bacterium]